MSERCNDVNKKEKKTRNSESIDKSKSLMRTQSFNEAEDNCQRWTKNLLKNARISKITQEYRDNKDWKPEKYGAKVCEKNMDKNRYKGIMCADENRVVLKDRDSSNDYIHASWMEMPDSVRFISTQGPIKSTIADFWHMIFTEKCQVIVMLCGYVEDTEKCAKYFSADGEMLYGDYKVKVVEKQTEPWAPVRYTELRVKKKDTRLTVHHYWYHDWHDQIAPLDPCPMIKLYRTVLEKCNDNPIVVHCSAGVGRTATFVGIHLGVQMIKTDPNVELKAVMKCLRQMRLGAIQSQLQYIFLMICILQVFVENKYIKKDSQYEAFLKKYADLTAKVTAIIVEEEKKKKEKAAKAEKKEKKSASKESADKESNMEKRAISNDNTARKHASNAEKKVERPAATPRLSKSPSLQRIGESRSKNQKKGTRRCQ